MSAPSVVLVKTSATPVGLVLVRRQLSRAVHPGDDCIFFAASGNGNGSSWNNRGGNGNYWSASFNSARNARNLNFNSSGVNPQNTNNRYNGFAVRPVQHSVALTTGSTKERRIVWPTL